MLADPRALELRAMASLLRPARVDRLDLFGPHAFARVRVPRSAVCVVGRCKRCLRARNALEQGTFCGGCQTELDRWSSFAGTSTRQT